MVNKQHKVNMRQSVISPEVYKSGAMHQRQGSPYVGKGILQGSNQSDHNRYITIKRGSPCPILFSIFIGFDLYPSNLRAVCLPHSIPRMKLTILLGMLRFQRLWVSLAGTAFGKAPSMSRKSTEHIHILKATCLIR
jgi:hypothetical protein